MADKTEVQAALDAVAGTFVRHPLQLQDGSNVIFYAAGNGSMNTFIDKPVNPILPDFLTKEERLGSMDSFVEYCTEFKNDCTRAFMHVSSRKFAVHFDYPVAGAGENYNAHHAYFCPTFDPYFSKWKTVLGDAIDQETYSNFIEDIAHTVDEPNSADLLDSIRRFEVDSNIKFKKVINEKSGTVSIQYEVEDKLQTENKLPSSLVLRTPVFVGDEETLIPARISYRARNESLKFVIKAPGIDKVVNDRIDAMVKAFKEKTEIPIYLAP